MNPYSNDLYLEIACGSPEEEAKCKQLLAALKENRAINRTAYSDGHAAGVQETLLKVQSELHEIAMNSPANDYESRYENLVVMLSEVDTVINKMLEGASE